MLEIAVAVRPGVAIVTIRGALVAAESQRLREIVGWLCEYGTRRVVLEAAHVRAVDLDGVVALMECQASATSARAALVISNPSPIVRLALHRTGFDTMLNLGRTRDAASRRDAQH